MNETFFMQRRIVLGTNTYGARLYLVYIKVECHLKKVNERKVLIGLIKNILHLYGESQLNYAPRRRVVWYHSKRQKLVNNLLLKIIAVKVDSIP